MSTLTSAPPAGGLEPSPAARRSKRAPAAFVLVALAGATVVLAAVHLTQGTASVGAGDLLGLLTGASDDQAAQVLVASRLPRLFAGALVGVALAVAGAALQSVARNVLASPDTLAVNAGAYFAVVAAAAFGLVLPALPAGGVAFAGGMAAAGLVWVVASGSRGSPTRLVLAGSAIALALHGLTMLLLLLFEQQTIGLFAWGKGSLVQSDAVASRQLAPVIAATLVALLLYARRLDVLTLGDDTAAVLGIAVRRTRVVVLALTVLLCACAVTLVGPLGFVGLAAPALVRLLAARVPGLARHSVLLAASGLTGVLLVLGSDVLLRLVLGGQGGVDVPTGIVTTIVGAAVLMELARRHRDRGPLREAPVARGARVASRRRAAAILGSTGLVLAGCLLAGMLLGDTLVRTGDLANWLQGRTGAGLTFVLDARYPRVAAATLAGAALALAGAVVQAVCRNPLADPGILGISGGAGVAAVSLLTFAPAAGVWSMTAAAAVGAIAAFALVYGLAWRGELAPDRLILVGIAVSAGCAAMTAFVVVAFDPWNTGKALTWLSGSTYGRTAAQVLPVLFALLLSAPLLVWLARRLDLLALGADTPRVLGVALGRTQLLALAGAALLTATAVSAAGVVGFVGLVAPHAARALVGSKSARVLPLAALLGAALVSVADTLGRTVIAPAQVPAGVITALVGTPYFIWLLWRSRA